ncbi:MAG: acyl-CoA dehydrogenase [Alphaproteobacteria bacterium]|nr:acyl-CoA dehydrogenase [Alphaproteobacteria bacterium]
MNDVLARSGAAATVAADDAGAAPWLDRVAALGPVLEAAAPEADKARRLTAAAMAALHEARLFRLLLPVDAGGEEMALPAFFEVIEALARHDGSTAWCVCQGNGCAMTAAYLDAPVAEAIWGGDPAAVLAWGPGKAEAVAVEGGYRVTARSSFVSGSNHATWLAAHCGTVRDGNGEIRLGPDGEPENRTAVFPAHQAALTANWDVVGLRGTGSDSFAVDALFVPEEYTVVRATMMARRRNPSPIYGFPQMAIYAMGFAATALGIARGFMDAFLVLAQEKKPRLVSEPICDNPVVQDEVARAEARLAAARAYLVAALERGWREAEASDEVSIEGRMAIRLAGTHATHEAKAVVDTLFDTGGTSAVFAAAPFERRFRDIHTVALQIQGRKTHYRTVGAWLLGHPPDMAVI